MNRNTNSIDTTLFKRALRHVGPIVSRHVFVLVNGVIFSVAVLLYFFGEKDASVFLWLILCINTLIGIVQDIQAMVSLERLQLITAARVMRVGKDDREEAVLLENIEKGDHIRIGRGDQIPCDGIVISSRNLEVCDALITGESDLIEKSKGDQLLAGAIVISGFADVFVDTPYRESRISQIAERVKKYRATPSPIQRAVTKIITYSSMLLVAVILFVFVRGIIVGEPGVGIVRQIGALSNIIVPQGLVVITTLLFALGAASYSRQHVLFREINASEKLGRIKNLCMDKTGTLTSNELAVEKLLIRGGWSSGDVGRIAKAYIYGTEDSSQTISAVSKYGGVRDEQDEIIQAIPFSSWRQYGAVHVRRAEGDIKLLVGPLDVFLPFVSTRDEKEWAAQVLAMYPRSGKQMLCFAEVKSEVLPKTLAGSEISLLAVYVFESGLREGIKEAIAFFQERGVKIRILSGDNAETACAVALSAGIEMSDAVITGSQMSEWSDVDYSEKVSSYRIFARVLPEQKVKIIEVLKRNGFTAMVGDGANDALAIRKADLGIAMFDGAQVTRQLASVVLMNNSFAALPGAVMLADSFIQHLEIFVSVFLNQSILGFFFFIFVSIFGHAFPFTPLNITPINYFAVGMPGVLIGYWAIRSRGKVLPASTHDFIRRVLPFPFAVGAVGAIGAGVIYLLTIDQAGTAASSTLFTLVFIILGIMFLILAPAVYGKIMTRKERIELGALFIVEVCILVGMYQIEFLKKLFEIQSLPTAAQMFVAVCVVAPVCIIHHFIMKHFVLYRHTSLSNKHR